MKKQLASIILILTLVSISSCYKLEVIVTEPCDCETCYDGIKNQNETGIDCGGVCIPCNSINDTIVVIDTLVLIDTISVIDTVIVIDTVYYQDTINISLQPSSSCGKDAVIHSIDLFTSGDGEYFWAAAWTWNGGNEGVMRALLEFNLQVIPINARIIDAKLSLYGKEFPPDQHSTFDNYSTYNTSSIQRITSYWDENEVEWDNQPTTTNENQVLLSPSVYPNQDYIGIDVTSIVSDIVNDPENGHGFMIKLEEEEIYRMMAFTTSDHSNPYRRPKLELSYLIEY